MHQYTLQHLSLVTLPICCLKMSRGRSVSCCGPVLSLLMMLDLPAAQQMGIPACHSGGCLTSTLAAATAAALATLNKINGLCHCCCQCCYRCCHCYCCWCCRSLCNKHDVLQHTLDVQQKMVAQLSALQLSSPLPPAGASADRNQPGAASSNSSISGPATATSHCHPDCDWAHTTGTDLSSAAAGHVPPNCQEPISLQVLVERYQVSHMDATCNCTAACTLLWIQVCCFMCTAVIAIVLLQMYCCDSHCTASHVLL